MMKTEQKFIGRWIVIGAIVSALAVALGAFEAHGLESAIEGRVEDPAKNAANWGTGSRYMMYHGLGIVLLGITMNVKRTNRMLSIVGYLFVVGVVLFSGSLFVLALTDIKIMGAVVPFGGLAMIVGWICFAIGASAASPIRPPVDHNCAVEDRNNV